MKLSEKLAALESESKTSTSDGLTPPRPSTRRTHANANAATKRAASSWDESKRQVRDLVLAEVAPKMAGLSGEMLNAEVKDALDRIIQREDVRVSPLERRK